MEDLCSSLTYYQDHNDDSSINNEPNIMKEEGEWDAEKLLNWKDPSIDGATVYQEIWSMWHQDCKSSVFIPLEKKDEAGDCSNYSTIVLISHSSKILLKIIKHRLLNVIDQKLVDVQAGFMKRA